MPWEVFEPTFPLLELTTLYGHQWFIYEGVTKSFRIGRLERELKMVQLYATRYSFIAILWVSLVSFAALTLFVDSQWLFIVVSIYFVIESVRKRLDTHLYSGGILSECRSPYLLPWFSSVSPRRCWDIFKLAIKACLQFFHTINYLPVPFIVTPEKTKLSWRHIHLLINHHALKTYWGAEV